MVTTRLTSATSRPITRAATVAYWKEPRIWSNVESCSFSGPSAPRRRFSAVNRSFSARSVPLSRRSWSISTTAPITERAWTPIALTASWAGDIANARPRCNSWATEVELVAMSPAEMASRIP